MDIHLLTRVEDDGSPFGVEYSTRRLRLGASGVVSCDEPGDALWLELAVGIPSLKSESDEGVKPSHGERFLASIPGYFQYHFLGPLTPLIIDHRGEARPDHFRIVWNPATAVGGGHGYTFRYSPTGNLDNRNIALQVAALEGWSFLHDFLSTDAEADEGLFPRPRVVMVALLRRDSPEWARLELDADAVILEAKNHLRAFLRRFFERQNVGCSLDIANEPYRQGRFYWSGGY